MEQALPTQYPDLGILFQNMPAVASWQVGTQQNQADQNNRSLQDAFSADQAQKALERPFDLQQKQATIRSTNAGADYNNALARNTNAGASLKEGTLGSDIKAGNAVNQTKLTAEHVKQMEDMGDLYRLAGARAATEVSPWDKARVIKEVLGDHVTQSPEFDKFLMQPNIHQKLTDAGNNIYEATRAAKAERMKEEAAQKRTETMANANMSIADANIKAGRWNRTGKAAVTTDQAIDKEGDPVKKYTLLVAAAKESEQDGDLEASQHYLGRAMSIKAIAEAKLAAQGGGQSTVIQPPGATKPTLTPKGANTAPLPNPGESGKPVATSGQQSPTDMIKKAFGEYNPDVYEYRLGPNGQPQRKKK